MAQLQPGPYLYFDGIGNPPVEVELRLVDKHTLGVFFPGRDDYDLLEEVSGRFEPDEKRGKSGAVRGADLRQWPFRAPE